MIELNPYDLNSMYELMDKYGDTDQMHFGKNENGEDIIISIFYDRIVTTTYQSNGWIRKNTYWRDGNIEEIFDGKYDIN